MSNLDLVLSPESRHAAVFETFFRQHGYELRSRSEAWSWELPKVLPWIEVNKPHRQRYMNALGGILRWGSVTDTVIVSTAPGVLEQLDMYDELRVDAPNMHVIPGVKTDPVLENGFDDPVGWAAIGNEVADMIERTGCNRVLLENESASQAYIEGREGIEWHKLAHGLRLLPRECTILWYPSVGGENTTKQGRMAGLCDSVAVNCPKVVFVDLSRGSPTAVDHGWSKLARERLDEICANRDGASVMPMQYFYPNNERSWAYDQIRDALVAADSRDVIIYPGEVAWEEAAEKITALLRPEC